MERQVRTEEIVPFNARRHLRALAELLKTDFAHVPWSWQRGAAQEVRSLLGLLPMMAGVARTALRNRPWNGYVWLQGGQVVGNITIHPYPADPSCWQIEHVGVVRAYRGRGMGRVLMETGLRDIAQRGGRCAILEVYADNLPAIRLYESLGFECAGDQHPPTEHVRLTMRRPVSTADL
jgi:ribosomal protein S18 acetylase RimI-like enzyme